MNAFSRIIALETADLPPGLSIGGSPINEPSRFLRLLKFRCRQHRAGTRVEPELARDVVGLLAAVDRARLAEERCIAKK